MNIIEASNILCRRNRIHTKGQAIIRHSVIDSSGFSAGILEHGLHRPLLVAVRRDARTNRVTEGRFWLRNVSVKRSIQFHVGVDLNPGQG